LRDIDSETHPRNLCGLSGYSSSRSGCAATIQS
jgi:hypothetical protein